MFISEASLKCFLRDVCALANIPLTGKVEYHVREIIKLIEFMGVGTDADNEDDAFMDRMSCLALHTSRLLRSAPDTWDSHLAYCQRQAGYTITPPAPEEVQPVTIVLPPGAEEIIDDPQPEVEDIDLPKTTDGCYSEGHGQECSEDEFLPLTTWETHFVDKRRRGKIRKIKRRVATGPNRFSIPPTEATRQAIRNAEYRLEESIRCDNLCKSRISASLGGHYEPTSIESYLSDNLRVLEDVYIHRQQRDVTSTLVHNSSEFIGLSDGDFTLLARTGRMGSRRWRPSVKMKAYLTNLLN